tara:strand:+ start:77307 stop:78626 length:1320 start_codon:yes stop_codon:yes gene_type:complete
MLKRLILKNGEYMKRILLLALSFSAFANTAHLPLDLTFEESLKLYKDFKRNKAQSSLIKNSTEFNVLGNTFEAYDDDMRLVINSGSRLSQWLRKINTQPSTSAQPVRLTSQGTQRGIPVERPSKYSPKIVSERFATLKERMPKEVFDILYGTKPIPSTLPSGVTKEEFIQMARYASGLYQTATRWNMMQPYMRGLIARSARDIRGYLFLKKLDQAKTIIANIDSYNEEQQATLLRALVDICHNATNNKAGCTEAINKPSNRAHLAQAYDIYMPRAEMVYKSFFEISNPRTDIEWVPAGPNVMRVVFKNIQDPEIAKWLKENVEDEFKLDKENFSLELNYIPGNSGTAFLEFKPGVTPHVSGGNKIVMDSNTDIQEYGVRWTIRHEFGHILRLPDCYTEFYDTKEQVMVNYQLDTTDLMCSRAGLMNERIYQELKKHYQK